MNRSRSEMQRIYGRVLEMHERGEKRVVMAAELGMTESGIAYLVRRLGIQRPVNPKRTWPLPRECWQQ